MTLVIAHRGAAAEAPENSIEAFDLGMSLGADAIELDVQATADGHLLVVHDDMLDRTTNGTGRIAALTRSDVDQFTQVNGEPVPDLRTVLERYPGVEITVDVKPAVAAGAVVELIEALDRVERTILYVEHGTDGAAFRAYRGRRATSTGQALRLATDPAWLDEPMGREMPEVIHTPMAVDGRAIVTHALVRRVHDSGRSIQVWTIDDENLAGRLTAWGVDGIITNDVRAVRAIVPRHPESNGSA